jgi:DNA polymerase V
MTAIIDCNSFYCSCERLFRPDLRDRPVVVLSNNDGCIISRSDEAKELGVGMAIPYFQARNLIEKNGITTFSSNYHLYGDMSWRVMETLRTLAGDRSKVEVYSVDEAFMDLSEIPANELAGYARHIRTTVEQWTGISVSIGVAPTKTLAKLANRLAKKNKKASGCVTVLATFEEQRTALQQTRVDDLWGVGWAYAAKLLNLGITSAWELSRMPEEWAHTNMGGVTGVRLIRELNAQPSIGMEEELTDKKMIATTRMFGRRVNSLGEIKEAVATYISRAAEKLRRQHSAAGVVTVFLVIKEQPAPPSAPVPGPSSNPTSWGRPRGGTVSSCTLLPNPTSLTNELIKAALGLADHLFVDGKTYQKAGVMLSALVPDDSVQGNLFVPQASNQHRFLMHTIDNINFSMRDDSVKFGASGLTKDWKMRQELRSHRHSTRWEELKEVN